MAGAVGVGAGLEFLNWVTEMDLGDPELALEDPASFTLPDRGDRAPDIAAMAARVLARCRPDGTPPPPEVKVFAPLLKEAGLL